MRIGSKPKWAGPTVLALAILLVGLCTPLVARAQGRSVQVLVDRIEQLERRLRDMERQFYRGGAAPRSAAPAASAAPTQAADVELRLVQLEDQIRGLTGRTEESDHQTRQLAKRYEKLVGDVDFRLKELEAAVAELKRGQPQLPTTGSVGASATASSAPKNVLAVPTTSGNTVSPAPSGSGQSRAALPSGTPVEQYKFATGLIRQKAFADAELAFRAFLDAYPDDRLAPNAQYWLGETLYVREKYEDAARVFLAGYQRYPDSSKASDSLLKLGVTLKHLGQRDEACATFEELLRRLPKKERRLRPKTVLEQRNAKCK